MLDLIKHAFRAMLEDVKQAFRAGIRSLVFLLAAGVLILVAVVFFVVGVYQSLAEQLEAWQAGGVVAVVLILLAVILALVARAGGGKSKSEPRPEAERPRDREKEAAADVEDVVGAQLGATISDLLRRGRPRTLEMVLAACAGALLVSRLGGRSRPAESDEAPAKRRSSRDRDRDQD